MWVCIDAQFAWWPRHAVWLFAVALFCLVAPIKVQAESLPPRVLIIFSHDQGLPAVGNFDRAFRREVNERTDQKFDVFTEYLDSARFPGPAHEEEMATYLKARYAAIPPQVLVTVADSAFRLVQSRRQTLFPGVPVVFAGSGKKGVEQAHADGNMTGIPVSTRIEPTLKLMLTLRPGLHEIILVAGAADYDRSWDQMVHEAEDHFSGRVKITYWSGLPLAEVEEKAARLPSDTAILYLSYLRDPGGATMSGQASVAAVVGAARVPVFAVMESNFGNGAVGGYAVSLTDYGEVTARLVQRIMRGERAGKIGVLPALPSRYIFDCRQLDRWKISRRLLPTDSELLHDRLPVWEEHPQWAVGVAAGLLLQSGVVAGLLVHRRRRRRIEAALHVSEERYREVVESQAEMVCRYLPDTTLTFANETYCRFLGKRSEELVGEPFLPRVLTDYRERLLEVIQSAIRQRRPVIHEHEMQDGDGQIRWVEWQDTPIFDERGQLIELQATGRDITERRQMADSLAESERNLAHAARLALVGELAASIAHEINQPLGAILANAEAAEMLLDSGSDTDLRPILADIRADDLRASEIIQHVRNLVSRREIQAHPLQLNTKVRNVLKIAERDARRGGVELAVELDETLPEICGDRAQIEQVLFNLLLNAFEAMKETPKEKRKLIVRTRLLRGRFVEMSVADTGMGIAPEKLPKIFDSFFTTKSNGMGLGLALARSIAELHGGNITAENNADGGAMFRLQFPIHRSSVD